MAGTAGNEPWSRARTGAKRAPAFPGFPGIASEPPFLKATGRFTDPVAATDARLPPDRPPRPPSAAPASPAPRRDSDRNPDTSPRGAARTMRRTPVPGRPPPHRANPAGSGTGRRVRNGAATGVCSWISFGGAPGDHVPKAVAEQPSPAEEAGLQGAHRHLHRRRRLPVRDLLDVAEHHRKPVRRRQAVHLPQEPRTAEAPVHRAPRLVGKPVGIPRRKRRPPTAVPQSPILTVHEDP